MKQIIRIENPAKTPGRQKQEPSSVSYRWEFEQPDYSNHNSKYHDLWRECHTKQNATPEWFADWINRVPKTCGCNKSLQAILEELGQPNYTDWFAYSVRLHNAVNRKLGKHELTHDEAKAIWQ